MKKLFLLFSVVFVFGAFKAYGQDFNLNNITAAATEAAVRDASILTKVDAKTGETLFYRKATCPNSGQAILTAVEFCTKSGKFVEAASYGKDSCTKTAGTKVAATAVAGAEETKCSPAQREACSAACAAACGKGQKDSGAKARMVSNNN